MTPERALPPGRAGEGRRPGSPGPRRVEPGGGSGPSRSGSRRVEPGTRSNPQREVAPSRAPGGAALSTLAPASRGPRRLAPPRAIRVRADAAGRPEVIGGRAVEALRESWLVEDRWWSDAPLRRRYWEVVTADGRDLVVFRDLQGGRWYAQR
jgi:hypothetical protein